MKASRLVTTMAVAIAVSNAANAVTIPIYHLTNLGTLGGAGGVGTAVATDVNASGQVVGDSLTMSGAEHAFRWSGGVMTDLGTLGGPYSYGQGINLSGQIVGMAYTTGNAYHAFSYASGAMSDLEHLEET